MKTTQLTFKNNEGELLSARLEMPDNDDAHYFAIFAHCFTCNKNFLAVHNICNALTQRNAGVLRFDFTGLGESEGDFSETEFSSNINDLICAAGFLRDNFHAASLLISHSLGGAAVLCAGMQLDEVDAIATIGAPADPQHVSHLLQDGINEIYEKGYAEVNIGGRNFTIKRDFLDDLAEQNFKDKMSTLRRAILIMHSPQDTVVSIDNAAKLYDLAHHPKSFISLDGADHLLTNKEDSLYAGEVISAWAKRYLD